MATKAKDLREKTDQELQDQLAMEKKRIFDATVRGASGEAIKPHDRRVGRRLIAKIQTVLAERRRRRELDAMVKVLEPKSQGASARFAKAAQREPRPHLARVKRLRGAEAASAADHYALKVAEARRLRKALEREDIGETR